MPDPKTMSRTAQDYWNLPDDVRAELVDGVLYDMVPPSRVHQAVAGGVYRRLANHIERGGGPCEAYIAPFAVNLDANDTTWVEPDVLVVCDPTKLSSRGCEGAPDLVVEVVSPASQRMDYIIKLARYAQAGVREYWICDPASQHTTAYRFDTENVAPRQYAFAEPVPVGIWEGAVSVVIAELLESAESKS